MSNNKKPMNRKKKAGILFLAGGVGASALLGGGYAAFNASATSSAQTIESGTVMIDTQGGTFTTKIENISPGDTAERTVNVVNTGSIAWGDLKFDVNKVGPVVADADGAGPLTTAGQNPALASLLTTGAEGLSVAVTTTVDGASVTLLPDTKIKDLVTNGAVDFDGDTKLALNKIEADDTVPLVFTYTLDADATNVEGADYSGLTDAVSYVFSAEQRAAGTFVETSPNGSLDGIAARS